MKRDSDKEADVGWTQAAHERLLTAAPPQSPESTAGVLTCPNCLSAGDHKVSGCNWWTCTSCGCMWDEDERVGAAAPQQPSAVKEGERDAARYRWLRERDLDAITAGGVFAGMTPKNVVLNGADLDAAIDAAMKASAPAPHEATPDAGERE